MKYKCVLFDMDGTLVNTYEGIFNSYKYSFEKMGLDFEGEKFVGKAIGAPLLSVFRENAKLSDKTAYDAVRYYREYYALKGKLEATLYEGIRESLECLKTKGVKLGIATLKRESFAVEILRNLQIYSFFDSIRGIDENDKLTKSELLNLCMKDLQVDNSETILVGDSEYDQEGANKSKIDFMAVTYGFGFKTAVENWDEECEYIIDNAYDIAKTLLKSEE